MGLEGTGVEVCVREPDLSYAHEQGAADLGKKWVKNELNKDTW